jgi:radical SAM protein with 4Fe4S-binding SPASM domain
MIIVIKSTSNLKLILLYSSMKLTLLFKKITYFFFIHDIHSLLRKNINANVKLNDIIEYNKERDFGYKPYLCYAPSIAMYFNIYGDVLACCQNTKDILGNINNNTLDEIWNSANRKELQNQINNYSMPEGCKSCHNSINSTQPYQTLARIYDMPTLFFGKNLTYPIDLTFEISNICNLECIMCNAEYSSTIRKNRDKLSDLPNFYPHDFFEQLKPYLINAKIFRFQGGEPFLINLYLDIIEYICKYNRNCKIYIQTNGTIYNNRVAKILSNKNISLSISIDSLKEDIYRIIRKNANLSRVLQNIEKYANHLVGNKNKININICIMKNNWKEIPSFFEFCHANNYSMTFIMVEYPEIYSIIYLNPSEVLDIKNYLVLNIDRKYKERYNGQYNSILFSLDNFLIKSNEFRNTLENYLLMDLYKLKDLFSLKLRLYLNELQIKELLNYFMDTSKDFNSDEIKLLFSKILYYINANKIDLNFKDIDKRIINELKRYYIYELNDLISKPIED